MSIEKAIWSHINSSKALGEKLDVLYSKNYGHLEVASELLNLFQSGGLSHILPQPPQRPSMEWVKARREAITVLELLKGHTPEQRDKWSNATKTCEELANIILELTNETGESKESDAVEFLEWVGKYYWAKGGIKKWMEYAPPFRRFTSKELHNEYLNLVTNKYQ